MRNRRKMLLLLAKKKSGGGSIWQQITGSPPLTLLNAKNSIFGKIKQNGKCTQASAPTPSSSVDIKCNNGAVKVRHRSGLPLRYQLLSYLRSTAAVDLGIKTTKNTELEAAWTRITSTAQYLYQSDSNSSGSTNTTAYVSSSGNWLFGNRTANITPSQNNRYVSIQNSNGVSLNGEKVASYATIGSFTSTNTLKVFGSGASLQVEYLKVRQSGELVRDLVPVRDTVDGTYGFYDLVGGEFYTNANATFTAGAEADDPIEVYTVGTPEVLTVSASGAETQTASVVGLFAVGDYKDEQDIISGAVTRNCGVIVLDGTETYYAAGSGTVLSNCYTLAVPLGDGPVTNRRVFCTHYKSADTLPDANARQGYALLGNGAESSPKELVNKYAIGFGATTAYPTVDGFKAFLAEQYAAGTPVIVVYPLTQETTESVTPQPLNTTKGTNVVEVTSNVDPVEMDISYKARRT